jgi:Gas vesicle synthesis protein GvpL/GvpF
MPAGRWTMNGDLGLYAYCVIDARQAPPPSEGVDARYRTSVLVAGQLGVVASEVPRSEFSAPTLNERLEDMKFLERIARTHDEIAFGAHATGVACPLPLCTIFSGPESAREMLTREGERLRGVLARIRGRDEWSVKVLAERSARATGRSQALVTNSSPGHAFFERRRAERDRDRELDDDLTRTVGELHHALEQNASESRFLKAQHRAVSGHQGEMVLNTSYLVGRSGSQRFAALVKELAAGRRHRGLTVALSGPFAPYTFVSPQMP